MILGAAFILNMYKKKKKKTLQPLVSSRIGCSLASSDIKMDDLKTAWTSQIILSIQSLNEVTLLSFKMDKCLLGSHDIDKTRSASVGKEFMTTLIIPKVAMNKSFYKSVWAHWLVVVPDLLSKIRPHWLAASSLLRLLRRPLLQLCNGVQVEWELLLVRLLVVFSVSFG